MTVQTPQELPTTMDILESQGPPKLEHPPVYDERYLESIKDNQAPLWHRYSAIELGYPHHEAGELSVASPSFEDVL